MTDRKEWLKRRKTLLGASDCAAVLGLDPWRGPLAVYAQKVGEVESEEDNDYMAYGRDIEGAIANMYARKIGRPVKDLGATEIQVHPDIPWLGATLDRVTEGTDLAPAPMDGAGPLELKSVGRGDAYPDQWQAEPPIHYQVQLQIQMAVTGAKWGSLAGLFPGYRLVYKDFSRHDEFLNQAIPRLEEFWLRVQRREPPEIDKTAGSIEAVKLLYPVDSGAEIELSENLVHIVSDWRQLKEQAKDADKRIRELDAIIRAEMKDASKAKLPDGSILTLKTIEKKPYTVAATSYRQLVYRKVKVS